LFQKVLVQHAGKFYQLELNALGQTLLGEIPEQIRQLQNSPQPSPWARPMVLRVTGDAEGNVVFDGTQDVEMELKFNYGNLSVDDVEGLAPILLSLTRQVKAAVEASGAEGAAKLLTPITIKLEGDVTGSLEKFDGSKDVSVRLALSETLRNQLKNSFLGTIAIPDVNADTVAYTGAVAVTGGTNFPAGTGLLWNVAGAAKVGGQFFQSPEGRLWHRMTGGDKKVAFTEIHTTASFNPDSKAEKADALGLVRESKDLHAQSLAALNRWQKGAANAPSDRGVYLETVSASGRRDALLGNQLDRLMFSADGRVFHQQNVDNGDWTRREFYHTDNFTPADKADLRNPKFLTGVGIYPGSASTSQNLLHLGWESGKHRWKLDLESDASLTLNAYSADRKEQHRLMRLRSRLAGGKSELELLANRTRIGVGTLTAIYGFNQDDWGLFNTATTIGFTDGKEAITYVTKHDRTLIHEGSLEVDSRIEARRVYAQWDAGMDGGMSCDNWFRSAGNTGWMNATYGGGWYMTDEKYIRSYNDKRVLAGGFSMSFRHVNRSSIRKLDYNGALTPIRFYNIEEGVNDYGFDLAQLAEAYPEAVETRNGATCVSVNAVGAILSAQNNKIESDIGDTNSEVEQLKERVRVLEERFAELGL